MDLKKLAEDPPQRPQGYTIPVVDLDGETHRQVIVDRTDIPARPAEGFPSAQIGMFIDAVKQRGEHCPDRSWIGRIIGMPADSAIDRTDIEAGTTPNTGKNLAKFRVGEDF